MRILVTGAAGFIGSHLADRLLADGHRVLGVDDLSTGRLENLDAALDTGANLEQIDVAGPRLPALVSHFRPEVVMHLAAQMDVRRSVADPLHDTRVNVLGTVNVLQAATESQVRAVVFTSSGGTVYGEPEHRPVHEDAPLRPSSPYGTAKLCGEAYLESFGRLHGLAGTSLRLGNVYGPRQDPHGEAGVVAIFARAMLSGAPTRIYGDGGAVRDYVHVDDVVEALTLALSSAADAGCYNIGTGVPTSVRQLHTHLAALTGAPDAPEHLAARAGELQAVTLDGAAFGRATGWQPKIGLEGGLAHTVDWVQRSSAS